MSRKMEQDYRDLISKVTLPKPVYKLDTSYSRPNQVTFKLEGDLELPEEYDNHLFADIVKRRMRLAYEDGVLRVGRTDASEAKYQLMEEILSFIYKKLDTPNPKLTKLYRHYKDMHRLSDDLYAVWKYIKTYDRTDKRHETNILAILKLLMERSA